MKTINAFLLTFLLNALWQIALVAAAAALGDWLLRRTFVRYRHFLWVAALGLSLLLPVVTAVRSGTSNAAAALPLPQAALEPIAITDVPTSSSQSSATSVRSTFQMNQSLAISLFALYLMFLGYRGVQLFRAWARTQSARRGAIPIDPADRIQAIVASCQQAIGVTRASVVSSASLCAPATIGIRRPLVILPDALVRDASAEVLTAAIGHELVHVRQRDYLLNLIYEIVFLPLSFHPAAALMRRRITQTRELRCDELVAELLLHPEVYARSLVQLAGSAMPFARRGRTVTVGIADADILEVRIMSLLGRKRLNVRRNRILLLAALVLLALPCAAAAAWRFHVSVAGLNQQPEISFQGDRKARLIYHPEAPYTEDARAKNIVGFVRLSMIVGTDGSVKNVEVIKPLFPSLDESAVITARTWRFEPYLKDGRPAEKQWTADLYFNPSYQGSREDQEKKERAEREDQELKERIEKETNPEVKAKLAAELKARLERRNSRVYNYTMTGPDGYSVGVIFDANGNGWRAERAQEAKQQAQLASLAKISMDQAIQIAVSQNPGKVFECSLVGERWEGPGELAKPSVVLYHVVILTGDEAKPTTTHVLVSALDGTIVKADKEERRKINTEGGERRKVELQDPLMTPSGERRPINGGTLNGKAVDLPPPEYPVIARAAHASGAVTVEITIDESGAVVAAHAVSGHPLLQAAAVNAARQATFTPTRLSGEPVKVSGVLVYNFVAQ
jgi:TonB family protein